MLDFLLSYYGLGLLCFLIALCAQVYILEKYSDGERLELDPKESGADIARRILQENDVHDVIVVKQDGLLVDHYDPLARCLALSPDVYSGCNASAAAVAAHEAGHALQHAQRSASLWMRSLLAYPAYIGIAASEQIVILGFAMAGFKQALPGSIGYYVVFGGTVLFLVCFACSLLMLINEFDASSRALAQLARLQIAQSDKQQRAVRSMLRAAALTYVASAVISAVQVLYWVARALASEERETDSSKRD
jgi:Zn-dependent membrane protease YugP